MEHTDGALVIRVYLLLQAYAAPRFRAQGTHWIDLLRRCDL
jgi:hypothetical protein